MTPHHTTEMPAGEKWRCSHDYWQKCVYVGTECRKPKVYSILQ